MLPGIDFLFDTTNYPARWHCGYWRPFIGWTHIISDMLIFVAYMGIPISILYYQNKIKALEINYIFYLFACFIAFCGTTHLIEAIIFWKPIYNFAGLVKFLTAMASLLTLGVMITYLPMTLRFIKEKNEAKTLKYELETLKSQREVATRQKMDHLKDEFISTVSHELRTPLTSMKGALEILRADKANNLSERASMLMDIANRNCERLILLIDDLLDLQKLEADSLKFNFDFYVLSDLIKQAVTLNQPYAQKYQVQFQIQEPLVSVNIHVDKERFLQLMANLLSNAAKFSFPGKDIHIQAFMHAGSVRVTITNTGVGISDEFRPKIFSKFAQADSSNTKEKSGTGLGLYISKNIVEKFGGQIGFESQTHNETTFYFDLPVE